MALYTAKLKPHRTDGVVVSAKEKWRTSGSSAEVGAVVKVHPSCFYEEVDAGVGVVLLHS